jgi:hypothetical protein
LSQPLGVEMLGLELSQYSGTTEGARLAIIQSGDD